MTTEFELDVTCAVCGATSQQGALASTNTMGYCDLDLRPAPMQRWTMELWLQRCPGCGYCAADLSQADVATIERVRSETYARKAASAGLPPLAVKFVCAAHLAEARGALFEAGWSMVHAAWACDDVADAADAARRCREWALALLGRAGPPEPREDEEGEGPQPGGHEALLADLARRAGRPDEARAFVAAGLAAGPGEPLGKILAYQRTLLDRGDVACHTIGPALGEPEEPAP
jgi:hypothetical protein